MNFGIPEENTRLNAAGDWFSFKNEKKKLFLIDDFKFEVKEFSF